MIARNADAATWDALHAQAPGDARGRSSAATLYQLLGSAKDEALARRALDLALTDEPGKTVSAGHDHRGRRASIRELALDFVLVASCAGQPADRHLRPLALHAAAGREQPTTPTLIPVLESYAKANLAASDRKPVQQAIDRIRFESWHKPQRIQ